MTPRTASPPCSRCDAPLSEIVVHGGHGRPTIRVLRCVQCGEQARHTIEPDQGQAFGQPSPGFVAALGFGEAVR